VQFDTTRNRFLAAGDEFQIKFWDMDNTNLLTTIDAEGGLPVCYVITAILQYIDECTYGLLSEVFYATIMFCGFSANIDVLK
jgi:hypothetical protein